MAYDASAKAFSRFVDEFSGESDRAAVVLGAAKLDMLLYQILDRHFRPSLSSSDELLDGDSPLSTFSARINIAYRLGLISADFAKSLHAIRKIRNSFAHELSGCSLEHGPQADRLHSLLLPFLSLPVFQQFRDLRFTGVSAASANFRTCLAMLAARLQALLEETEPLSGLSEWKLIPPMLRQAATTDSAAIPSS